MEEATVRKLVDGTFAIMLGDVVVRGGFATQAEAWRAADRHNSEVITPAEKRNDWFNHKLGTT